MTRYYCTYFDRNYLLKALAMIESLKKHEANDFRLYAVCLDEVSRLALDKLELPNVVTVGMHEIEQRDFPLLGTKRDRTAVEYYWTSTPTIILRLMERNPEIDILTYLDADLYFFSSPDPIFEELGDSSVLIHEHRYSPTLRHLEAESGRFNVGLVSFRNDATGEQALNWWRERCIEWCFKRVENGKMGDQVYLNEWPKLFEGVKILKNVGAGVAPWNHIQYNFDTDKAGNARINGGPLLFYHFHALHFVTPEVIVPALFTDYPLSLRILELCFMPYIEALHRSIISARQVIPDYSFGLCNNGLLATGHTFLAKNSAASSLANAGVPQIRMPLDKDWDCYCSPQLRGDAEGGNPEVRQSRGPAVRKSGIKVSAIVSTYNSEKYIRGCLDDLIEQTLYKKGKLEIVVVNTGSQQNEREIVDEYKKLHENITHIYIPERETVYGAWNHGVKAARGEYITNANTDDRHRADALEIMASKLDERPDVALVYADVNVTEQENASYDTAQVIGQFRWLEFDRRTIYQSCYIGPQPMWRRELHDRYGYFDPEFISAGDYEFWLRMVQSETFLHIPEALGLYLKSPESIENRDKAMSKRETRVAVERHRPGVESAKRKAENGAADEIDGLNRQQRRARAKAEKSAKRSSTASAACNRSNKSRSSGSSMTRTFEGVMNDPLERRSTPGLSLCMIVRDEEKFIEDCLNSVEDMVDEIIVVDTGSSDRTLDIARAHGAKLFSFEWNDSYADARNESLKHATGDWILVLDADERLDAGSKDLLRRALRKPDADGYNLLFQNVMTDGSAPDVTVHRVCRLFLNKPEYRYESRVHEHVENAITNSGGKVGIVDVLIHHYGYRPDIVAERGKHERYVRMLEAEVKDRPDDIFYLHHLAAALCAGGEYEKAVPYLQHATDIIKPNDPFAQIVFCHLVNALREINKPDEALKVVESAERLGIRYPQLSFCKANALLALDRPREAIPAFEEAIKLGRGIAWTGDAGTSGYKADFGLASAYLALKDYAKAVEYAELVLKDKPENLASHDLLANVYQALDRPDKAEHHLHELRRLVPEDPGPVVRLAELYERQGRLIEALAEYDLLARGGQETVTLRVKMGALSEALGDAGTAETYYNRAIEVKQDSPEAHDTLGLFLANHGRPDEALGRFARAIEIDPAYANAYFNAGDVLYGIGSHQQAADIYQHGLEQDPNHVTGFFALGNCYCRLGVFEAAVLAYKQALFIRPDYAEARNNLALAEDMLQERQAA